ncbi:MAG: hypothetical protein F4169_10480 [Gammaproteobacteria bacterium]|nr:hypothetical protein [Gammaproteobacteria bacterium]
MFRASGEGVCAATRDMATQAERITALEVHYEHVDKTLTAMSGTLDAVRAEVAEIRTHLDDRFNRIQMAIADDKVASSETKFRVALRVTGWLAGVVATVLGAVVGGLFVFARFLLPRLEKLAFLAQDTASLVG